MSEYYQKQVDVLREMATVFMGQISDMPLSPEEKAKIDPRIIELQRELAEDAPDLVTIRDLIALIKDIIDGARPILLH